MKTNLWAEYNRVCPWMSKVPVLGIYFFGIFSKTYFEQLVKLGAI